MTRVSLPIRPSHYFETGWFIGESVAVARGIRLAALRAPLVLKLIGANVFVVASLATVALRLGVVPTAGLAAATALLIVTHLALVLVALRPVRDLEATARRVWEGDYGARVSASSVADNQVLRVGSMFNILLDGLAADRARTRALARDVIATGERERAALARELQESTAQHVAALLFEVSSVARDASDPRLAARLGAARDSVESILEELRTLSNTVHPIVLGDFGIEAGLRKLAREASAGNDIVIDVDVDSGSRLPPNLEAVLYRVAQEAVHNAKVHGAPRHVRVTLRRTRENVRLSISDDGCGFDLTAAADSAGAAGGLNAMRERLSLVDGTLEIETAPNRGTTVTATIPHVERINADRKDA